MLDLLERDPMECAELLDWPAKLRLLDGFRHRENLSWSAPRLHLVDLQYSDVRLDKGLYNRLVARGSMKRLVSEHQVLEAGGQPAHRHPGVLPRRMSAQVRRRYRPPSWDSVIFDLGGELAGADTHARAAAGSKAHVGALPGVRGTRADVYGFTLPAEIRRISAGELFNQFRRRCPRDSSSAPTWALLPAAARAWVSAPASHRPNRK
ncbi:pup-ligase family protein [Mycobacterium kansasii 662]|uniref:Pup-ligase family protein n=1 Tax=Mycobacterium kansasii 662 TaxID=1299326 RepID=X7XPR8_MYCKA|nr:pup-ligase family protein [Mycobacterium kansasii 662]